MTPLLERGNKRDTGCRGCRRATASTLCARCVVDLVDQLKRLPALLRELGVVVTRQDHLDATGVAVYGRKGEHVAAELLPAAWLRRPGGPIALPATPWAYAPDAASLLREARAMLAYWVDHVRHARRLHAVAPVGPACVACNHSSCRALRVRRMRLDARQVDVRLVIWLIRHRGDLAQDERAGELVGHVREVVERVEGAVFGTAPDVFLGTCGWTPGADPDEAAEVCPVELYAAAGALRAVCRTCDTEHVVEQRQALLMRAQYDQLRPVRDVADALSSWVRDDRDEPVACTPSMVRGWVDRGRLAYKGTDRNGVALVRLGDVADLLLAQVERDRARREKHANRARATQGRRPA